MISMMADEKDENDLGLLYDVFYIKKNETGERYINIFFHVWHHKKSFHENMH